MLTPAQLHAATAAVLDIKLAFIENFTKYVTWPPRTFETAASPFRACVIGNGAVSRVFDAYGKNIVNTHEIKTIRITSADDAAQCHFIYFSESADPALSKRVLKTVENVPVLTIGDVSGFINKGGIIKFKLMDKKLSFEINPAAARRSGLEISSRLLKLAIIVSERSEIE